MKKILVVLLAVLMIFSICACEKSAEMNDGALKDLYEAGYVDNGSTYDSDNNCTILFLVNEEEAKYNIVKLDMTEEDYNGYMEIFFGEEDEIRAYLTGFDVISENDISDKVPTEEETQSFVGLTIQDVEDMGYEEWGNSYSDTSASFLYSNGIWSFNFQIEGEVHMDDLSPNEIKELVIGESEFTGFGDEIYYL